jgi:uncharacterized membrane protein YccC
MSATSQPGDDHRVAELKARRIQIRQRIAELETEHARHIRNVAEARAEIEQLEQDAPELLAADPADGSALSGAEEPADQGTPRPQRNAASGDARMTMTIGVVGTAAGVLDTVAGFTHSAPFTLAAFIVSWPVLGVVAVALVRRWKRAREGRRPSGNPPRSDDSDRTSRSRRCEPAAGRSAAVLGSGGAVARITTAHGESAE